MKRFKKFYSLILVLLIIEILLYINFKAPSSLNDYIELPSITFVESNHLHLKPNIKKIQSIIDNVTVDNTKYVQYICDYKCGGWGDRLKGIMSSFMLSLVLGRRFLIKIEHPCDMKHFFSDNDKYWSEPLIDQKNKKQIFIDYKSVSNFKFVTGSTPTRDNFFF
jgi:hypothetical protein